MIARGDQLGGAGPGRRAQVDVQLARRGGVQAVQDPDVARDVVHDPHPVRRRVADVEAVVVGVPPQVAAVERGRVNVAGALVVGEEHQPAADEHRRGELAIGVAQHSGEERIVAGRDPEPAPGAAAVALPERGVAAHPPGQQRGAGLLHGQVVDLAERQPARGRVERHRVRPAVLAARLARCGDREHLAVSRPAADAGPRVAPVGVPRRRAAVRVGRVHLGSAIPPAGPGDLAAVPGEPGIADVDSVRGQPPGAAAVGRGEPDVVFGDEGEKITVNVGKPEISRRRHAAILRAVVAHSGQRQSLRQSQPRSSATRSASVLLRAPVFWMQADR